MLDVRVGHLASVSLSRLANEDAIDGEVAAAHTSDVELARHEAENGASWSELRTSVEGGHYHRLVGATPAHGLVVAGREAVRAGDFEAAARSLEAALAIEPSPEAYGILAFLGYVEDDFEEARRLWELAFHGYLAAGDLRGAGLAAVYLAGTLYDGFLDEPGSREWLRRAGELLNQVGRCVERGYLALALVACHVRDAHALEQSAVVALELAKEFGDPDLEARARADRGLALINQGRIAEGFDQLDQAMAAIVAGTVSPLFSGTIFSRCSRHANAPVTSSVPRTGAGRPASISTGPAGTNFRSCTHTVVRRTAWCCATPVTGPRRRSRSCMPSVPAPPRRCPSRLMRQEHSPGFG